MSIYTRKPHLRTRSDSVNSACCSCEYYLNLKTKCTYKFCVYYLLTANNVDIPYVLVYYIQLFCIVTIIIE